MRKTVVKFWINCYSVTLHLRYNVVLDQYQILESIHLLSCHIGEYDISVFLSSPIIDTFCTAIASDAVYITATISSLSAVLAAATQQSSDAEQIS